MRFTGTVLLFCAGIFAVSAAAQPASTPQPVTRTVVAASKLPNVVEVPELYRSMAPIPDLKPGTYDLNLTRITFPPNMPSNPDMSL